ncbi:MAG: hypothetical protein KGJ24_07240 [Burkholderiales bacterium]|nr:hypothetical protein [Burkholderiales bacterium]
MQARLGQPLRAADWPWVGVGAAVMVGACWIDPGAPWTIALAALAYAALVSREPHLALLLVPIALALTDVTAFSGPRWFDALDGVMLATALLAWAAPRWCRPAPAAARESRPLAIWLLAGLLPAAVAGLRGLDLQDPNALLTPLGSGHGLMLAKGLLGAAALGIFVHRLRLQADRSASMFGRGMVIALAGVVGLTVQQRLAFVRPFDFSAEYRVPGPFSAIALGGAYIECFLAAAVPFAVVAAVREPLRPVRWLCGLLVLATAYATMVTYSRGGQVVFLGTAGASAWWLATRSRAGPAVAGLRRARLRAALLGLAVAALSALILLSPYATERFERLGPDARIRLHHWQASLGLRGSGAWVTLFGTGLGSYGRDLYIEGDPASRPGLFVLHREATGTWLRLHPGLPSYLDQRVRVAHGEPLTVSARVRSRRAPGLQVLLCEKDLIQSRHCAAATLDVPPDGRWHRVSRPIELPGPAAAAWPARPVRLSLFPGPGVVDVDDLSLTDAQGREQLRNGRFEDGAAHWSYASDEHLQWHMKNLWLQVDFEQGALGVAAHAALLLAALAGAWRAARPDRAGFMAIGLALLAFQGVGLIDSVIDTPRLLQLYLSLALLGTLFGAPRRPGGAGAADGGPGG